MVQSEPPGAQMTRFLAAVLFTVCAGAPSVRADSARCSPDPNDFENCPSYAYDISETMTVSTSTNQEFVWTFQREQDGKGGVSHPAPAWSYDVAYQTDPSIVFPGVTGSFFIHGESVIGISDLIVPEHTLGLLFGPGLRRRPCLPDCTLLGNVQSFDMLFIDDNFTPGNPPDSSFTWVGSDSEPLVPVGKFNSEMPGTDPPPTATPEPSDLLLFGTGVIGLGFVRKFTSLRK